MAVRRDPSGRVNGMEECKRAHEVGEGREDRLPKEDMRGAVVGQDG